MAFLTTRWTPSQVRHYAALALMLHAFEVGDSATQNVGYGLSATACSPVTAI